MFWDYVLGGEGGEITFGGPDIRNLTFSFHFISMSVSIIKYHHSRLVGQSIRSTLVPGGGCFL